MPSANPCVFQSFDEASDPATVKPRIAALRGWLKREDLAGFVIPRSDQHQSEYVAPCDERLAWATGFTGSAGSAVVLLDKAALIVDGRYTLQSAAQTDTTVVTPVQMAETSESDWIARNLPEGGVLGYDPWVHTPDQVKRLAAAAARAGGALKALPANPVDALWTGRPKPPAGLVRPHPAKLTGEGARAKIARLRKALAEARCGALVISDPHNLCWLLNLRGSDVPHTPLAFGYGVVRMKGPVTVVMEPAKIGDEAAAALRGIATVASPAELPACSPGSARRG